MKKMNTENEIKSIVKYLAIEFNELVVEIHTEDILFHGIEWNRNEDRVILHQIVDDLDYEYYLDEMDEEDQKEIYLFLFKNYIFD